MNLNELFQQQKALDQRIVKEKGLQGKDLLKDKTVALICELYECVNENRHFKFWSENREPKRPERCFNCKGSGCYWKFTTETVSGYKLAECKECDGLGNVKNKLLEEYIDTLHFTLSIANDFGYHSHKYIEQDKTDLNQLILDITYTAYMVQSIKIEHYINLLVNLVIQLGYELGFAEEEVIAAYFEKNAERDIIKVLEGDSDE